MRLKSSIVRAILLLVIVQALAGIGISQDKSETDEQRSIAPATASEGESKPNASKDGPVPSQDVDDLGSRDQPSEASQDRQSGTTKLEFQHEQLSELLQSTRAKHDELLQGSNVQNELVKITDAKLEVLQKELARIQHEMKNDRAARMESIRTGKMKMEAIQNKLSEAQSKLKNASAIAKESRKNAEKMKVDAIQKELSRVQRKLKDERARNNASIETERPSTAEPKFDELSEGSVVTDSSISISQLLRKHLEDKLQTWEQDYRDAEKAVMEATASYRKDVSNDASASELRKKRDRLQSLAERSFNAQLLVQECRMQLASIDLQLLQAKQQHRKTLADKIISRRVEELITGEKISERTSANQKQNLPGQATPDDLMPEILLGGSIAASRNYSEEAPSRAPVFFTISPLIAFNDVLDGKPAPELTPDSHVSSQPYAPEGEDGLQAEKRRSWTETYVDEVNKYLANGLETEISTENWRRVAGSLDKLIVKWSPSDKANFRRTGELLLEFANRSAVSSDESRRGLVQSALYLRQVARMTGVIPKAIKRSSPSKEGTTARLNLLSAMLDHQADLVWINQEQVRLAGLIDEAPYQVVRLLIEKKGRDLGLWLYVLSSVYKDQASLKFHDVPPIDPLLFVTIIHSLTGATEENDRNICQLFNQKRRAQAFSKHIDDIMRGKTVHRTTVQRAFAGILRGTKSDKLKDEIKQLVPGMVVFLDEQQKGTNVLRDRSGRETQISTAKAIPRDVDSIFEALTNSQVVTASGLLRNHNFPINHRVSLTRLSHELEVIVRRKQDISIYITSDDGERRSLSFWIGAGDSAPELALQILTAIETATERPSSTALVEPNDNTLVGYEFFGSGDTLRLDDYDGVSIGQWKSDERISFALPPDCDRSRIAVVVNAMKSDGKRVLILKSASEKLIHLCATEADARLFARAIVNAITLDADVTANLRKPDANESRPLCE